MRRLPLDIGDLIGGHLHLPNHLIQKCRVVDNHEERQQSIKAGGSTKISNRIIVRCGGVLMPLDKIETWLRTPLQDPEG